MKTDEKNYAATPERINAFSDGVFAIIITIMILELKHPSSNSFRALFAAWPVWVSYVVSYIFIAPEAIFPSKEIDIRGWVRRLFSIREQRKGYPREQPAVNVIIEAGYAAR